MPHLVLQIVSPAKRRETSVAGTAGACPKMSGAKKDISPIIRV
mgnify:CR=1 FL=1